MQRSGIERLLGKLYADADFSEACFEPFMAALGERLDSHVLALHTHDVARGIPAMVNAVGVDAELQALADATADENIWFQRGVAQLLAEGMSDDEQLADARELHRTRFHADFLRAADLEHGMGLYLGPDAGNDGNIVVMTINRSGRYGCYTDDERNLAKTLLPHLRNAFALHGRLRGLQSAGHAYRAVLDGMVQPVVLVAANGAVLFANEGAQQVEAGPAPCLQRRNGRLAAIHPRDEPLLQTALLQVASGATGGDPLSLPLHDRFGRVSALLTICPTPPSVFANWSYANVAATVFIRSLQPRCLPEDVRAAFGLTAAEFRLAALLLSGATLDEAAGRLGTSKNTTRTQLRSLFDKTGTRRQSELVSLLHRAS